MNTPVARRKLGHSQQGLSFFRCRQRSKLLAKHYTIMLSKQALDEYREIYRQEHGEVPSDEVLVEEATKLLTVFDLVYRPVKKVWLKEYEQREVFPGVVGPEEKENRDSSCLPQGEDRGTEESN